MTQLEKELILLCINVNADEHKTYDNISKIISADKCSDAGTETLADKHLNELVKILSQHIGYASDKFVDACNEHDIDYILQNIEDHPEAPYGNDVR